MTNDNSPSDILAHLGYWLRTVSNAVSYNFALKMEEEGVTVAEWVFLRVLYDVDEIAPSLLAKHMGMTKGAISKLADRLIEKNLVERIANPDNIRSHLLKLKPDSRRLVLRLAELADQNDTSFFDVLNNDERQHLKEILKKIASVHKLAKIPIN